MAITDQDIPAPLKGVRVLDLTRLLPGAFCTQMLADMGAEVIKVEQPGTGDYWRWIGRKVRTESCQFLDLNRGKKSIALDLKMESDRAAFLQLCETADVLLEGFRPGVMDRLGLGFDTVHAINERLVYASLSGFGQDGPWAKLAAHDLNYQGMTGILHHVNGNTDDPRPPALPIGDIGGGSLMAVSGILAGLLESNRTGRGRHVDISVMDGLLAWSSFMGSAWNAADPSPEDTPFDEPFDKPFYTTYRTADGRHLVVGAYEKKFWDRLCDALGLDVWKDKQWAEGEEEDRLRTALAEAFAKRTLDEWMAVFSHEEACVTPVLSLRQILQTDHVRQRGLVIEIDDPDQGRSHHIALPIRFDGQRLGSTKPAPRLGANGDELLGMQSDVSTG